MSLTPKNSEHAESSAVKLQTKLIGFVCKRSLHDNGVRIKSYRLIYYPEYQKILNGTKSSTKSQTTTIGESTK